MDYADRLYEAIACISIAVSDGLDYDQSLMKYADLYCVDETELNAEYLLFKGTIIE